MRNNLLQYAEAKLIFREEIFKFVEMLDDQNVYVTNLFGSPHISVNEIYIYDNQAKWSHGHEVYGALHFVYFAHRTSFVPEKARAKLVAEKFESNFLSLHGKILSSNDLEIKIGKPLGSLECSKEGNIFICNCNYEIHSKA